jgi:hypothetical protein
VQLRHLAWRRYNSAVKSAGRSQLGVAGRRKTMKLKSIQAPFIIFQLVLHM